MRGATKRSLALGVVLTLALSCATANADVGDIEASVQYVDPEVQEIFAAKLRQEGIVFRQTPDGTVWYPLREKQRVDEVNRATVRQEYGGNAVIFHNAEHARLFRQQLEHHGIRYEVKVRSRMERTTWNDADDPKVQEIMREVDRLIINEAKSERLRRQMRPE